MSDGRKELALLSNAKRALAACRTLPEVVDFIDRAAAAKTYAKAAKLGVETVNLAVEAKLRAERKAGKFLKENLTRGGDRKSKLHDATLNLAELGIEKTQSHRWQQLATVPEATFEQHVESYKASGRELTTVSVRKLAAQQPTKPAPVYADAPDTVGECVGTIEELSGLRFGCIYADPPWSYGNQATRASTDNHYATMSVDEICAMPVADFAADDAHLHLWTTNAFLFDAERVIASWGFEYRSCFVWVKPQMGIGNYWRVSHEFLLLGIRGNAKRFNRHDLMSWGEFERGKHSAKPERIRTMIETASPGPYLEIFGRNEVDGWTVLGNQISEQKPRLFA